MMSIARFLPKMGRFGCVVLPRAHSAPSHDVGRVCRAHALAINADGWLDVLEVGQWNHEDGPEKVTAEDIQRCFDMFQEDRSHAGDNWAGVAVYVGHPELNGTADSAPSFAWCKQARVHGGVLQFLPQWNPQGEELIAARTYKFISNYEYGHIDDDGYYHPGFISSVALTNFPARKEGMKPLANSGGSAPPTAVKEGDSETGVEAGSSEDPQNAEVERAHASEWWRQFQGELNELVGDAENSEEALQTIWTEWQRLYDQINALNAMETLIYNVANSLDVAVAHSADGGLGDALDTVGDDLVARANALRDSATRAERLLATETKAHNSTIVDMAVLQGVVNGDAQSRQHAATALAGNRDAVRAMWGDAAKNASRGHGRLPASPLTGVRFHNAMPAEQSPEKLAKRAHAHMKEHGCSYQQAFNTVSKQQPNQ